MFSVPDNLTEFVFSGSYLISERGYDPDVQWSMGSCLVLEGSCLMHGTFFWNIPSFCLFIHLLVYLFVYSCVYLIVYLLVCSYTCLFHCDGGPCGQMVHPWYNHTPDVTVTWCFWCHWWHHMMSLMTSQDVTDDITDSIMWCHWWHHHVACHVTGYLVQFYVIHLLSVD